MRVIDRRGRALVLAAVTAGLLSGCGNAWQKQAEFAPPQSRWPETQPSTQAADAPPAGPQTVHCYRTLAIADCFATPQPGRAGQYIGTYPTPN